jgi:hypothetical protein
MIVESQMFQFGAFKEQRDKLARLSAGGLYHAMTTKILAGKICSLRLPTEAASYILKSGNPFRNYSLLVPIPTTFHSQS